MTAQDYIYLSQMFSFIGGLFTGFCFALASSMR